MSDKEKSMKELVNMIEALRETVEKGNPDSAESKEKINKLTEKLTEVEKGNQEVVTKYEAEVGELKANLEAVKNQFQGFEKAANRIGAGSKEEVEEVFKEYSAELDGYLRKGTPIKQEVLEATAEAVTKKHIVSKHGSNAANEIKTMFTGNDPEGGYWVLPDRRTDITVTRDFETSPMRAVSNIITTTSNEVDIPIIDTQAETGGWRGEVDPDSETGTPNVGLLTIATHEQFAQPVVTTKMLQDAAINIEAFLSEKLMEIFTQTENTAFVNGDGSKKPKGFLQYDALDITSDANANLYQRDTIGVMNSGKTFANGSFSGDSFIKLAGRLKDRYQANAKWLMQRITWTNVLLLKDGRGQYLIKPEILPQGAGMLLNGKQVLFANDMQAQGVDALSVAYGDFRQGYTIVDRLGMSTIRDVYTSKGFVKYYTTKRVGGGLTSYDAIKLMKIAE